MADSVARRPHTATSVRGLISPPSPILVVWLHFTVFLSSLPCTCLLIPSTLVIHVLIFPYISLSPLCFPPNRIHLQFSWSSSVSRLTDIPHFSPCPILSRSLRLCVSSSLAFQACSILLNVLLRPCTLPPPLHLSSSLRCLFLFAELQCCVWLECSDFVTCGCVVKLGCCTVVGKKTTVVSGINKWAQAHVQ